MKHGFATSSYATSVIKRAVRFRGKTAKGKVSPNTFASLLAHPGEPISHKAKVAGIEDGVYTISPQLNLQSVKTSANMSTRIEFPTTVENSCTAVHHLTKALFLSKRVEPPLNKQEQI